MAIGSPRAGVERAVSRALSRVTGHVLGPYQAAIVRIGFGCAWFFFLLREWPHRQELYGPDGPWSWGLAEQLIRTNHSFTVLMWSSNDSWFQLVYLLAMASSAAMILGWHTRAASALFMVGVLSLQNRSVFMGDGGDNVIHLMAMYLVLTRCARVWSLDARRAARERERSGTDVRTAGSDIRTGGAGGVVLWALLGAVLLGSTVAGGFTVGWGLFYWAVWAVQGLWWVLVKAAERDGRVVRELRDVCDVLANLAHNGVLLVIMVEVCLIYSTAGWFKIQGTRWQDGTAVYYPMKLDYFTPWPELSSVLAGSGLMIFLVTYGTVATQVAFPFTLLNRRVKNVLLAMMIIEHLSIAALLGLPFFSLAMIAADAVFLPTVFLVWSGRHVSALAGRAWGALPGTRRAKEPGGTQKVTWGARESGAPDTDETHEGVRGDDARGDGVPGEAGRGEDGRESGAPDEGAPGRGEPAGEARPDTVSRR